MSIAIRTCTGQAIRFKALKSLEMVFVGGAKCAVERIEILKSRARRRKIVLPAGGFDIARRLRQCFGPDIGGGAFDGVRRS